MTSKAAEEIRDEVISELVAEGIIEPGRRDAGTMEQTGLIAPAPKSNDENGGFQGERLTVNEATDRGTM